MKCYHCSADIPADSRFCPACGKQPQTPGGSFCLACGAGITEGQRFCAKCGTTLNGNFQAGSAPVPPATSYGGTNQGVSGADLPPAGVGLRCIDGILDFIVLFIIGSVIAFITGQTTADGFELHGMSAFTWWLIGLVYYVAFEVAMGATPGKMLLGLRVIKTDGAVCDLKAAIIRNVCRIVDNFLAIGVFLMLFSKRNQRFGDRLAGTIVVKAKTITFSQTSNHQFGQFDD